MAEESPRQHSRYNNSMKNEYYGEASQRSGTTSTSIAGPSSRAMSPERMSTQTTNWISSMPPASQSQNHPRIHACRWSWCRLTFDSNTDLVHHVIHDHVRKAIAVRRGDLPIYRRAEEGLGESLSLSGLGMSYSSQAVVPGEHKRRKINNNPVEAEPTSSLPSPPESSPTSLPPAAYEDDGRLPFDAGLPTRTPSHSPSPEVYLHKSSSSSHVHNASVELSVTLQRRQTPPTFTSLSSPIEYPYDDMFPDPTFDSLVENVIGSSRSRTNATSSKPDPHSQTEPGSIENDRISPSSSFGSHASVEKQLTQSMDMDYDSNVLEGPKPILPQPKPRSTTGVTFNGAASDRTPLQVTPGHGRQAWYGTRPARSHASPLINASQSASRRSTIQKSQSIASQPYSQETPTGSRTGHAFRSGTLQLSPTASQALEHNGSIAHLQSQVHSPTNSQFQTQDSSLDLSYLPLQTQAPYQSQSSTQTQ
ncbi:hypothetical protein D9615_000549 [Tricholomella constricta]|uniref:C2H2-type domain-containing protein n=1 Tax=Tricholomella constricta TaxID=117010 RepID=A0A8H5MBP8_9AGAR|nr:hypothetical protein D9615_000549 [Tricholomella constricta]